MEQTLTMARTDAGSPLRLYAPIAVAAVSAGMLGFALMEQFVFGLAPCELCLYQRVPYDINIVIGLLALLFLRRSRQLAPVIALCGLVFAAGGGIAAFHVGVEQHWWKGLAACSGDIVANTLDALRAQLMATKVARCDEIAWSLFGISMAGWNFLLSTVYAVVSLGAARAIARDAA